MGNSTASPKKLLHRKSRSKDYDVYSDNDTCSQESEDTFAKELQQYIQAKEMANAAQSLPFPEELKKEGVKDTQKGKGETVLSFCVYLEKHHSCPYTDWGLGRGGVFSCILFHRKICFPWILFIYLFIYLFIFVYLLCEGEGQREERECQACSVL